MKVEKHGECVERKGNYGKERKSFHRFNKQNVMFGRNQHNSVNILQLKNK